MNRTLEAYRLGVPVAGGVLLAGAVVFTSQWVSQLPWILPLALALALLRRTQLPVTKYAAVQLVGMVAVGGSLVLGPVATGLVIAADASRRGTTRPGR